MTQLNIIEDMNLINNNLTALIDEIYSLGLEDEVGSIDACYTFKCRGVKYKPNYGVWVCNGSIRHNQAPMVEGYVIWLELFNDFEGSYSYVYYPKTKTKDHPIKVLFQGQRLRGFIEWVHGESGLYDYYIFPLTLLDALPRIEQKENSTNFYNTAFRLSSELASDNINKIFELTNKY